jgi:hypothetical protein
MTIETETIVNKPQNHVLFIPVLLKLSMDLNFQIGVHAETRNISDIHSPYLFGAVNSELTEIQISAYPVFTKIPTLNSLVWEKIDVL